MKTDISFELTAIYSSSHKGSFFNIRITGGTVISVRETDGIRLTLENDSSLVLPYAKSNLGSSTSEITYQIPESKLSLIKASRLKRLKFQVSTGGAGIIDLKVPKSSRDCIQSGL